jgi:SAM-dependent methyltransferase
MWKALKQATRPARTAIARAICPSIAASAPPQDEPARIDDLSAWAALARNAGGQPAELVAAHGLDHLSDSHAILQKASPRLIELISAAIDEIVRWQNIIAVRDAFDCGVRRPGHYFGEAERYMAWQWENVIWPIIKNSDFTCTLEIACGHGRQSEYLRRHSRELHLVDVNASVIDACRERFGEQMDGCRFHFHITDGNHLRMIADDSITFVSSWDSMVHFDKTVMRDYVIEIARVLKPGGTAFLHHSNIGASRPNSDWSENHGTRGDMSAAAFQDYAREAGLVLSFQRLSGTKDGWGLDDLDCLSVVAKPN